MADEQFGLKKLPPNTELKFGGDNTPGMLVSGNEDTLPAEKEKQKAKTRDRRSNDTKILEELKNIRKILALNVLYMVSGIPDNDMIFLQKMVK